MLWTKCSRTADTAASQGLWSPIKQGSLGIQVNLAEKNRAEDVINQKETCQSSEEDKSMREVAQSPGQVHEIPNTDGDCPEMIPDHLCSYILLKENLC